MLALRQKVIPQADPGKERKRNEERDPKQKHAPSVSFSASVPGSLLK
jgi:hypothetical protein